VGGRRDYIERSVSIADEWPDTQGRLSGGAELFAGCCRRCPNGRRTDIDLIVMASPNLRPHPDQPHARGG
jgi:hypothetical protein